MKDRKTFKIKIEEGKDIELSFKDPNQEELLAIDLEYRKIFSQCLREGIMSEAEAKKIAEKNGVWTKDDNKKLMELATQVAILGNIVDNEDGKCKEEQVQEALEKLPKVRAEMIEMINRQVDVVSSSAEGLARDQKMHKFAMLCCITSNGNRFFDSLSSYEKFAENHRDAMSEIFKRAYYNDIGDIEKISEDWPEVKYLRKKMKEMEEEQNEKNKENSIEGKEVDKENNEKKSKKRKEKEPVVN